MDCKVVKNQLNLTCLCFFTIKWSLTFLIFPTPKLTSDWWWCERCSCPEEGRDWHCHGLWHRCCQVSLWDGPGRWQLLQHCVCCWGGQSHLQQHEAVYSLPHLLQRWRGRLVGDTSHLHPYIYLPSEIRHRLILNLIFFLHLLQYLPDSCSWSSWGSDPSSASVGEPGDWRSSSHSSGLQPPWFGHHGQSSPLPQRAPHLWLAVLQIPGHWRYATYHSSDLFLIHCRFTMYLLPLCLPWLPQIALHILFNLSLSQVMLVLQLLLLLAGGSSTAMKDPWSPSISWWV